MIIFNGEINEDCKCFLRKKQKLSAFIKFIVMFLVLSLPIICVGIAVSFYFLYGLILTLLIAIADVMLDKSFGSIPNQIIIDDYSMEAKSSNYELSINLSCVKSVIDMGAWYNFEFDYKINNFFVCQKDLLVEGSIKEFEKLFEDKLKRLD